MSKKAQDYDVFKSASPEMQEFIKEIDDMIDRLNIHQWIHGQSFSL